MTKAIKNLVLYGPPGTGKTRKLLHLIEEHCHEHPGRVLFCSHTKAAALEATSRWPAALADRLDIQTLHSVCFQGLKLSRAQTVDDDKLLNFGHEFGIDMSDDGLGPEFINILSLARSRCIEPLAAYEQSWRPGTASHYEAFVRSYTQWKETFGYMDFNDMLHVGALRLIRRMVDYGLIAIDEAQDLTPLHWTVVYRLMHLLPDTPVIVAGDDDQALYSFAGADPAGMPDFGNRTGAESMVLSQSYRITQQVYDVAQAIIARVVQRVPKVYAPRTGFDGRPAQGKYEVWPHMDHLQIDRNRDSLLLYNDRFVRSEVEPILQEDGYQYKALNGYPSPTDSRAGRALRVIHTHTAGDILDDPDGEGEELRKTVRSGLSSRGVQIWDHVSASEVLTRIRRGDLGVLAIKSQHYDYLRSVDWRQKANLRISTFHGAKGLQGDDVHLILSLSQAAMREAIVAPDHLHRLMYTAFTRTKENLFVYDGENPYELPAEYR